MRAGWAWAWAGAALALAALSVAEPEPEPELLVSAVAWSEEEAESEALAELLRAALGGGARAVPAPEECAAPDSERCVRAALRRLATGALQALLLPAPRDALPAPAQLRDAGLRADGALEAEAEGDARRGCWARGALRALPELAQAERALPYRASGEDVAALSPRTAPPPRYFCGATGSEAEEEQGRAEPCAGAEALATAFVGPPGEARVLRGAAREHALRLQVVALGAGWDALRALRARGGAALLCGRALDAAALRAAGARALGPPPCRAACAFDPRPLLKLSDARAMARAPAARRALERLALPPGGARALGRRARERGAAAAAREALLSGAGGAGAREVRVAVLLPLSTRRAVADARALRAAAELAERDEAEARGARAGEMRFKVELVDSGCSATRAFKYLTDALGAEFEALSGVAGGACAGAFAAVARQSAALALPVLAFLPRTAEAGAAGERTLLAAGDAREATPALAALLAALGWRRAALLTEAGGRAALDAARLGIEVTVHVELPEGEDLAEEVVEQWAMRASELETRVLVVAAEDARAVLAALCAGARAGLAPRAGAVYVLLGAPPGPLAPPGPGAAYCPLAEQAEGHLRLVPEWEARWQEQPEEEWTRRWRAQLAPPSGSAPGPAPAAAALLYDALRLWAGALARLLRERPEALDDLHREDRVA